MSDEAGREPDEGHLEHDASDGVHAQISREMVRLYKDLFGRGPTKARTTISKDLVVCTLEDSQTPAERSLARLGEHQRLRDTRTFFQHASEGEFRGVVESLTGREVRAFVSGMDVEEDVSAELFYLRPEDS